LSIVKVVGNLSFEMATDGNVAIWMTSYVADLWGRQTTDTLGGLGCCALVLPAPTGRRAFVVTLIVAESKYVALQRTSVGTFRSSGAAFKARPREQCVDMHAACMGSPRRRRVDGSSWFSARRRSVTVRKRSRRRRRTAPSHPEADGHQTQAVHAASRPTG